MQRSNNPGRPDEYRIISNHLQSFQPHPVVDYIRDGHRIHGRREIMRNLISLVESLEFIELIGTSQKKMVSHLGRYVDFAIAMSDVKSFIMSIIMSCFDEVGNFDRTFIDRTMQVFIYLVNNQIINNGTALGSVSIDETEIVVEIGSIIVHSMYKIPQLLLINTEFTVRSSMRLAMIIVKNNFIPGGIYNKQFVRNQIGEKMGFQWDSDENKECKTIDFHFYSPIIGNLDAISSRLMNSQ